MFMLLRKFIQIFNNNNNNIGQYICGRGETIQFQKCAIY